MADLSTLTAPLQDPISGLAGNAPAPTPQPKISDDISQPTESSYNQIVDQVSAPSRKSLANIGDQYIKATQPLMKDIGAGIKADVEIANDKDRITNESEKFRSQVKANAYLKEATDIKESQTYNDYEKIINELQKQEFIPNKENAQDLAQLFTFVSLVGFGIGMGGKGNAQAAMSAMTGMLEGHRQGRDDLYKREKDIFETNLKALKEKATYLDLKLKNIIQLASIDRQAAELKADELFYETQATYYKSIKDKQGLIMAGKIAEKNLELVNKAFDLNLEMKKSTLRVQEQLAMLGIKQQLELGPFLREFSKQYPQGTLERLYGASNKDKDIIFASSQAITQTEEVADYIMKNQKAVGALASAKNFINLDAIKSIKSDETELADAKAQLIDDQLDEAVKEGKITADDAQSAKVLQKKLFALALADVRGSGQRGSIYLDKQFQKLYDQASRPRTLIDVISQRENENNNNLSSYKLGIQDNVYKQRYPLFNEGAKDYYLNRVQIIAEPGTPPQVIEFLRGKEYGSGTRVGGKTYRIYDDKIIESKD